MSSNPQITLYFLQASRCIRTAWLLEELNLPYTVTFADRENGVAPQWLKDQGGGLGKFPTLKDGDTIIYESGNITEYLCDKYDTTHRLLPPVGDARRYEVLQWVHAAEATFALHALAVLYARWNLQGGDVEATEAGLGRNVQKDLDYLEKSIGGNKWIVEGEGISAADIMMEFTVAFIFARELGTKGRRWERLERYVADCQANEAYQRAVKKTGHKL